MGLFGCLCLLCSTVGSAAPRIAIFDEMDFPYYMATPTDNPRCLQDLCLAVGLEADLLSVTALADPDVFNAREYAAYIHAYGNAFPLDARENLVAFHEAGGCMILVSGVPFCHPVIAASAANWHFRSAVYGQRTIGDAHSGQAMMRISNARGRDWSGPACPRMESEPGRRLIVGGWMKLTAVIPAHEKSIIYLRFFNADGEFIGQDGPDMPRHACDWTRIAREVVVPEGTVTMDVSPQLWSQGAEVLVDDLFLFEPGAPDANLLPNPSFETPGGGWTDLGHVQEHLTHTEGLGTGSFTTVQAPGGFTLTEAGRRIGLDAVRWDDLRAPRTVQTLDLESLPPEDRAIPLVTLGDPNSGIHPAVMIRHGCPRFDGAIDVWCRSHCSEIRGRDLYHITLKSTIAVLRVKGAISDAEARDMIARTDETLGAGQAPPEPVREDKPFAGVWPRSNRPAETIDICDVSEAGPDEEFALAVLQGLANRETPRLYLIHSRYAAQDWQWLDELQLEGLKTRPISIPEAWERYGSAAKGAVLYDRSIMDEIGAFRADRLNLTNIILMICATRDAVPLAVGPGESAPDGRPIVFDTRGKWETPFDMHRWAFENLWPEMNHHILATLYPGIFYLTDYLVQHKVFTFWFGSQRTFREQEFLERILASTPPNTPIIGWWFCWMPNVQDPAHRCADCVGEGEGVRIGSAFGKFLTPSHECTNLSVHSGMPLPDYKHKPVANPVELDGAKVYYSFIMSDGDNLGECLMMRRRGSRWDVPERGEVPMGWSHAPAAAALAPPVHSYYLRTVTEKDLLVGGLGIAYTRPDQYATAYPDHRDEIYAEYARMTADSLAPLDTGALWLIGGSREDVSRYAAAGAPLTTIFPDYGTGHKRPYEDVTYMDKEGVAVFRAVTGWGGGERLADRLVREIQAASDGARPAFLHVFLLNWSTDMPMLQEVMSRLGDEYVCVRPDELGRLFREAQAQQ